jgi:preprotein translocase SecE subunit
MATAVEPSSAPSAPGQPLSLPIASLLGAVYVAASLAVVVFLLPVTWSERVTPQIQNNILDYLLWIGAQLAVIVGLSWFGLKLLADAPKGTRGGIFLVISFGITIFFLTRALALNIGDKAGWIVGGAFGLFLAWLAVRFCTGQTGQRWMVSLEEQGWFSLAQYKRSLGLKVRRLTILGILIVGGSGAWALLNSGSVPEQLKMTLIKGDAPEQNVAIHLMNGAKTAVPLLIAFVTLWFAWRAVNVPTFAEFLIATEAEMNKVSWSTRKRLFQDTIVVLITTLLMTLFLLVVDLFWGWLLSRSTVGVLPSRSTGSDKGSQVLEAKW